MKISFRARCFDAKQKLFEGWKLNPDKAQEDVLGAGSGEKEVSESEVGLERKGVEKRKQAGKRMSEIVSYNN